MEPLTEGCLFIGKVATIGWGCNEAFAASRGGPPEVAAVESWWKPTTTKPIQDGATTKD